MMYYIESPSHDPYYNLALEEYVFERLDRSHSYFMLWQNDNAIIVGKHQNTIAEVNAAYVKERGIQVVRRLSGGGAVYHDLGNINFTFIVDSGETAIFDFSSFCQPVVKALGQFGVQAEINGRNDITIEGKKFSGNSQYGRSGRIMHHGTIMYDSNLEVVAQALCVSQDKLESKGVKSIHSRVTNVKPYLLEEVSTDVFFATLRAFMTEEYQLQPYVLTGEQLEEVVQIQKARYDQWDWNYGKSPTYHLHKERRVEGCGKLEIFMDVERGYLKALAFYGDYFSTDNPSQLVPLLLGCKMEETAVRTALGTTEISRYFNHMDLLTFISILLE